MVLPVSFSLALGSLRAHRTRTLLTTLGVVIGVFIISLILILSGGLRASIINQTARLNDDVLLIRSAGDSTTGMEAFSPLRVANATTLAERDVTAISKLSGVRDVAPMMFLGSRVESGQRFYDNITTVATNDQLPDVLGLKMISGDWFSDKETARNYVILGEKLASGLIETNQAMGQKINIKGKEFMVVGVVKTANQPISLAGVDVDKAAFISLADGVRFTDNKAQIGQIIVRAVDKKQLEETRKSVVATLQRDHFDDSEFAVHTAHEAAGATAGWLATITLVALIFASISLLVGGIGIMNIMLVSVTERVREIGIRKAVGATKRQILEQFLLEALLMTLGGGLVGLLLAYAAGYVIALQFSLPLVSSWWIFAIGLGVPLVVGLLFGLWPAARAARQDPIVALKQYH
ncbi:ABC transporter permease [Candidatus Saccharibacteria bacterium]|nr:ABC transporter permease [Candidatus Saccharibacteria bacterium]